MHRIYIAVLILLLTACSSTIEEPITEEKTESSQIVEEEIDVDDHNSEDSNELDESVEIQLSEETLKVEKRIKVFASLLNVRKENSTESEVLDTILLDDEYTVLDEKTDIYNRLWYQVETDKGNVGWIASWYCHNVSSEYSDENDKVVPILCDNRFFGAYVCGEMYLDIKAMELIDREYNFSLYQNNSYIGQYDSINLSGYSGFGPINYDTNNTTYNSTFSIACSWNPLIREVSELNESYSDNPIIDTVLHDNDLTDKPEMVEATYADIDNDGHTEAVIYISNITDVKIDKFVDTEPTGEDYVVDVVETIGNTYSILFIADEGDYVELKKSIDSLEVFNVRFIGDIDDDQNYEVVTMTEHFDFIHLEGVTFTSYTVYDNDFESLGDLWVYPR